MELNLLPNYDITSPRFKFTPQTFSFVASMKTISMDTMARPEMEWLHNDPEKRKLLTMNDINNPRRVAIIDGRISISFFS